MKMKNVILLMAMMIGLLSANAQSNNPFVGVWQGVSKDCAWGDYSIKISEKERGDYIVQVKGPGVYSTYKGNVFSQNEMSVVYNDETEYGKWKIGRHNGEYGQVLHYDDGYYGWIGPAEDILYNEEANRMEGYTEYIFVIGNEGELNMWINCYSKYYSGQRLLFTTGSPHDRSVYDRKPIVFVKW